MMREYLVVIFTGILATFLYNYFASLLRAVGNSITPLIFLAFSAVLNIVLDLWFVIGLKRGVAGAAEATVISQYVSGIGLMAYTWIRFPQFRFSTITWRLRRECIREITGFSLLTCIQQSVMNLGILMVQGLVNSFGTTVMAAFAAAVKIDSFAYMPVQDFEMPFPLSLPRISAQKKRTGSPGAAGRRPGIRPVLYCDFRTDLDLCPAVDAAVRKCRETAILAEASAICILKEVSTAVSAACSCCTAVPGSGKPGMSVVLTPSPWEPVWLWLICFRPSLPWAWWESGGPSPSAGLWQILRDLCIIG